MFPVPGLPKTAGWFDRKVEIRPAKKIDPREDIWRGYQEEKTPDNLDKLLHAYDREVNAHVASLSGAMVPSSAVRDFARKRALRAFRSWRPGAGSSLASWVNYQLKNTREDVDKFKSEVKFTGKRAAKVGEVLAAQDHLRESLGREPTVDELSTETGHAPRVLVKLFAELNPSVGASTDADPFGTRQLTPDHIQLIRTVRLDLNPVEQLIMDYRLGINGKQKMTKQSDIAKAVGVSDGTVTRKLQHIMGLLRDAGRDEGLF